MSLDSTDFKAGISAANRELRLLDSQFKAGVAAMGDWTKSSSGLEQRVAMLNQSIGVQSGKVAALKGEYERVAAEKGETSRAAQELQIQLNRETEKLGKMTHELGQTENALNSMGNESEDTAKETKRVGDEAQKAEKDVKSFGERLKDLGKGVGGALAGVGKVLAGIGAAAVGAVGGLSAMVVKSADAAGELVDLSLKTGLSVTTLQELQYVGDQVGVDLDKITGGLARFTNAIEAAATGTGPLAEDINKLGINVFDANGQLRDSRDVYFEAIDALGQMDNATEREILAQNLFGKSFQELMPLIGAGKDELAALTEEAHRNGAVMSEEAVMGLEAWGDQIAGLKGSLKGLTGTLAASFLPAFSGVTGMARSWMSDLAGILSGSGGDLESIGPELSRFLSRVFTDIGKQAPGMVRMGMTLVRSLLGALLGAMPTLIPAGVEIVNTLVKGVGEMLPMLIQAAPEIIMGLIGGLAEMLPQMAQSGTEVLLSLVDGIGKMLPKLIPVAVGMIVTLINGIARALPQLMTKIAEIIPQVVIALIQNLPLLIQAALQLIVALVNGLAQALPVLISYIPEILTAIVEAIIKALPMIINSGKDIIKSLINGIKGLFSSLKSTGSGAMSSLISGVSSWINAAYAKGRELMQSLINGLKGAIGSIGSIGSSIVNGLWNGIISNWAWLVNKIKQKLRDLFSNIRDLLGITSPSKLFARGIGKPLAEGIGVGFLREMDAVEQAMRATVAGLMPAMEVGATGMGLGPAYSGVGKAAASDRAPVTINVNPSEPIDYELLANKVARRVAEGW